MLSPLLLSAVHSTLNLALHVPALLPARKQPMVCNSNRRSLTPKASHVAVQVDYLEPDQPVCTGLTCESMQQHL